MIEPRQRRHHISWRQLAYPAPSMLLSPSLSLSLPLFPLQLADFGFSRVVDSTVTMTRCGSPLWIAPEIVRGEKFNESSDVFSFSVVVWEILAWQEPYPGEDPTVVMAKVAQFSYRPKRDPSWPKILNTLMKVCQTASRAPIGTSRCKLMPRALCVLHCTGTVIYSVGIDSDAGPKTRRQDRVSP